MAFAAERGRSDQLDLVNRLMREIAGNLSRERILETSVRRIQETFRFSAVMIGIPDRDTGTVRTGAAAGSSPGFQAELRYPLDEGVMGRAIRFKQTAMGAEASEEFSQSRMLPDTRSELAIPILFIGLLVVGTDTWPEVVAALAGAVVTWLAAGLPNRTGLLVGALAGVAAGTLADRFRRD